MAMFDCIVDEYGHRVFLQAMHFLGNREDAEDATQEVFLRVHRSLDRFRGDSTISTWIFRITYNVCMTVRESRSFRKHAELPDEGNIEDEDPVSNPVRHIEAKDSSDRLTSAIARLSPHESAAITLFYMDDKSYDEIAAILDIPRGTVSTALHRGRERLREILQDDMREDVR